MIALLSACGRCASGRYGPPYWLTAWERNKVLRPDLGPNPKVRRA